MEPYTNEPKKHSEKKSLHKRFVEGLAQYGLTYEDIKPWTYIGGPEGRRYNYFAIKQKGTATPVNPPEHKDSCVCKHPIKENCWITKDYSQILVVGNCCKNYFIHNSGRTCGKCGTPTATGRSTGATTASSSATSAAIKMKNFKS